jgi:polyhydroxybutyrate depolymerase
VSRTSRRAAPLALAVILTLIGAPPAAARTPILQEQPPREHRLVVHGVVRTYRVHAPAALNSRTPVPLVVVLHGAGATAKEVERRYHWDPLADRAHFVVAYPQALDRRWNDSASPSGPDDVGFLAALLDTLEAKYPVDHAHVYVTGISNGGIMTYRAGCALAGRLAAIGPVAAWFPDCLPDTPLSVVHIHGLMDDVLPYDGGAGSPPVDVGLARWRAADGCPETATTAPGPEVSRSTWSPCTGGTAMELVTLATGRHEWPGAIPKPGNDPVSNALDATQTIWTFFAAHAR